MIYFEPVYIKLSGVYSFKCRVHSTLVHIFKCKLHLLIHINCFGISGQ